MHEDLSFLEANKFLIRYYYIYKYKSFNRASKNFYIAGTDRNMKYAVSQLENFYAVQLIKVSGNKLEFTEFGHILGEQAENVFKLNIKINSLLNKINLKEINFATTTDYYKYYIKPVFDVFQKENPDAKIVLLKTNQLDSTQRLINREIDFIVGAMPVDPNPDLVYQTIAEGKILIACLKENEKIFQNIQSLPDIKDHKGGMCDFTHMFYYSLKQTEKELDIELNMTYYTSDFDSLIDAVQNKTVLYALVGNYSMTDEISFIDISRFFKPQEICFIYRKNEALSKAIEKLIKISDKLKIKPIT